MLLNGGLKRAKKHLHPYLAGNFAPIHKVLPLTPCTYSGTIPQDLAGGQYIRNGGNPLTNEDIGRDAHWFDGDGMLSGVLFQKTEKGIAPEFVNQYILTDVYLQSKGSRNLKTPILPSIATLVNPLNTLWTICLAVFRTIALVILSHLPGSIQAIKKISVANTNILWHDGRALATCESGPPMRIQLPELQTVGWFNGRRAQGEPQGDSRSGYGGGSGIIGFMYEWTTGHPKVDPDSGELIAFHCTFIPPFINYSIVPATQNYPGKAPLMEPEAKLNMPIPGVSGAKMMHDFGVSKEHTIIMDLPLSLDPTNLARGQPVVAYDPAGKSRFGVFPRYNPEQIYWYETNPCCIFHTANAWETTTKSLASFTEQMSVDMLACRLTSASLIFSAGDIAAPEPTAPIPEDLYEEDQCRLYYYSFPLPTNPNDKPSIRHQWALSAIPFEFPTLREDKAMRSAKYVYGCSNSATFTAALGRAVKIDYLAKIDVETLIARGLANAPEQVKGCVDKRTIDQVRDSTTPNDPIQLFHLPEGYYAQEPRFVPRETSTSEDDGFILTYVFDESQLHPTTGEALPNAKSELWIIDAKNMKDIIARIHLPQRVPYGLHGNWFTEGMLESQRPVLDGAEGMRIERDILARATEARGSGGWVWRNWIKSRDAIEQWIG